jgi:fatty-acyl-CoA synthase
MLMLISEILSRNAHLYADEVAIIEREPQRNLRREMTWRMFDDQANQLARALMTLGIVTGDRVVILMTNCMEWLPIYFGVLRTGALAVPLNYRFDADTIKRCTETAQARVVIFEESFNERLRAIHQDLDVFIHHYLFVGPDDKKPPYAQSYQQLTVSQKAILPRVDLHLHDDAAIYFTSGTTGTPKGVLLTQGNLWSACTIENQHHKQTHTDNFLCIPPLYHTGAKMHWFGNFLVGAKTVILKGVNPQWILDAVSQEGVTIVWLLVPWAQDILMAIDNGDVDLSTYRLDQWRLMHIGAQPVPPSLVREWKSMFPHHAYDTNYGLTEAAGPGCVHLGMDNEHKVGAIGRPGHGWKIRVVDDDHHPVKQGDPGELMIKGPGVMKAYYRQPDATSEVLNHGWLLTGDIVREDDQGFLWLVDRKKDVVITGGENIYPVEIEDFLQTHPAIQDVGVIGIPDARLGEIVAAVIDLKPGRLMDETEIRDYCQGLPKYKRPRKVFFHPVPRNPTGKIEKPKLRKQFDTSADR